MCYITCYSRNSAARIVSLNLRSNRGWNINQNPEFIRKKEIWRIVCQMLSILLRPQDIETWWRIYVSANRVIIGRGNDFQLSAQNHVIT